MPRLRAALPLLLTILGFVAFGGVVAWRVSTLGATWAGAACVAAALIYGAWLLWESRISVREVTTAEGDHDRGTLELAALAKYGLLIATLIATPSPSPWLAGLGLGLMIFGAVFRGAAITRMGEGYTHRIRAPRVPLVTGGPYAWVRHPAYLGTLLAHTGLVLVLPSVASLAALLVLWLPAVVVRVVVEDRFLRALPEYGEYARSVRFGLVPGVF